MLLDASERVSDYFPILSILRVMKMRGVVAVVKWILLWCLATCATWVAVYNLWQADRPLGYFGAIFLTTLVACGTLKSISDEFF